ncbi:MAG: S-adenosylmethionine:tRNA ribosyltransferase-isomerase [Rikenellaceae bacterium]|jgi:S-adenosylmethionine:tRNA ribosyltransferase-isomerase|nr:S-adenosylmethionine:tRNA ribosyltransferase-isomerase [Rikenellaceae bacterium]
MESLEPIRIEDYDYDLPPERIAQYPLPERDGSKLLVYRGGTISESRFSALPELLPEGALLVFNNTRVIHARIFFFKETSARIEIFCLDPHRPADTERAFAQKGECAWRCIVGNSKKWKEGTLRIAFEHAGTTHTLRATREGKEGGDQIIRFNWEADLTFGQLLELLGTIPIPPYLNRESQAIDESRYQTVYSKCEGSVAAPTAGLHFTEGVLEALRERDIARQEVTLHIGAGTFLPVKSSDARQHPMHTEHFEVTLSALKSLLERVDRVIAVGTTSVRTLESLAVLGYRVLSGGSPEAERTIGQWEAYDIPEALTGRELIGALVEYMERQGLDKIRSATQIMITPAGFRFRLVRGIVTNFHQPKSTLLLLISTLIGGDWKRVYNFALKNDFRFLSYGDSSLLLP